MLSIIVLNYNGRDWLPRCLDAVLGEAAAGDEIIVVDNASTDGSLSAARERPRVTVVPLDRNVGFAAGNNAGAASARGEYLVFLNNDAIVQRGWLSALRRPMDDGPTVGLTTSRIVFADRPEIVDSAGDGYLRAGGAYKRFHGQPSTRAASSEEVFGACGAAFMIRRALFEELGGFDEDFFMVYEDVDLSYRARLLGWRCVYAADSLVHHGGSSTLGRVSAAAVYYGQRNLEWVYIKNTPAALLARSIVPHVAYDVAAGIRYATNGRGTAYLRAKWAALQGLPRMLRKRRAVQGAGRVQARTLWARMDAGWIAIKRREKHFDLRGPA